MTQVVERHIQACRGFSDIVARSVGRWERPSPCAEWDARGVVEHVIGFHDVLLLVPLDAKPHRPKGDPAARWAVTATAIGTAVRAVSGDPAPGSGGAPDLGRLLPVLTADVLVHTWDLARAVGVDPGLDLGLCAISYEVVRPNDEQIRHSGMFGPAVPVPDDADAGTKLVAFLGRDPSWTAP